jgi:hypothetical protein
VVHESGIGTKRTKTAASDNVRFRGQSKRRSRLDTRSASGPEQTSSLQGLDAEGRTYRVPMLNITISTTSINMPRAAGLMVVYCFQAVCCANCSQARYSSCVNL